MLLRLLLDEPFEGIDPATTEAMAERHRLTAHDQRAILIAHIRPVYRSTASAMACARRI